jgi:DNA-binding Lrp family transcriptional regulator
LQCAIAISKYAFRFYKVVIIVVVGVTMVNVVPGEERYVYRTLMALGGIREVYHVFGEYDFVVIIEVEGLTALNNSVDNIRDIKGVTTTHTIVGAEL